MGLQTQLAEPEIEGGTPYDSLKLQKTVTDSLREFRDELIKHHGKAHTLTDALRTAVEAGREKIGVIPNHINNLTL